MSQHGRNRIGDRTQRRTSYRSLGARGANGVILVTTKRGQYNTKMQVNVNYKYGMDFPINQPEFANGYEYAAALNEALYYDGLEMQYTRNELDAFKTAATGICMLTLTGLAKD